MADDVSGLLELLSTQPGLLNSSVNKWNENPLFIAFKYGCLNVFKEITRQKPELAREKDQGGYSVLHLASITGDIAVVKALLELNIPQLCLLEDNASMIPLQTAVMEGHGEVIRALVLACPNSLERVTYRHKTLFHLALNNYQLGAFQVLMEETRKFHQERLFNILNWQDDEGNTVLHIATAKDIPYNFNDCSFRKICDFLQMTIMMKSFLFRLLSNLMLLISLSQHSA